MALIDILNDVLAQSSFLERSSFANSSDPDDKQMVAIANRTQIEVREFYPWMLARKVLVIPLVSGQTEYALPADFSEIVPDSAWETDGSRKIDVPVPDTRWYMYKFSTLSDAGTLRARVYGKTLEVQKDFAGTNSITLEYDSTSSIESGTGTPKEKFTEDTDVWLLDEEVLTLGIQANWAVAKMLPQANAWMQNYMDNMGEAVGRTTGGQTIGGPGYWRGIRRPPYTPLWKV
jgi:hypothetical protein